MADFPIPREEDRVIHSNGAPADLPVPGEGHKPTFRFSDPDERRRKALAELESTNQAQPEEGEEELGDELEESEPETEDEAAEDLEVEGHGGPRESEVDKRIAELERKHAAEMAMLRDQNERTIASIANLRGQPRQEAEAAPKIPDPDEDPGGYVNAVIAPVQETIERMQRADQMREQERRLQMVNDHIAGVMDSSDVFKGSPNLASDVRAQIVRALFTDPNVTMDNWQDAAVHHVRQVESRYGSEIRGKAVKSGSNKVAQMKANKSNPSGQRGAGSGSAPPSAYQPPKIDFRDPEQRRRAALEHLKSLD